MNNLRPKRLLMTGDTVGGVWTFALDLAEALAAHHIQVLLATCGAPATRQQRAEAACIPNLLLVDSSYKLEWMDDPWADVEASREWLREILDWYKPELVHLNSFGHAELPYDAPVVLTAHSCVLSWYNAVKGTPAPDSWDRYRHEVKRALQSADLIVAPSQSMLRSIPRNYGTDLPPSR